MALDPLGGVAAVMRPPVWPDCDVDKGQQCRPLHMRAAVCSGLWSHLRIARIIMGMSIGNTWNTGTAAAASGWQERQQNFKALSSAIQSGQLGAAQQAYTALTGAAPGGSDSASGPLSAVAQALQQGDISGAQRALSDLQAKRSGGHLRLPADSAASRADASAPDSGASATLLGGDGVSNGPLSDAGPGSLINLIV